MYASYVPCECPASFMSSIMRVLSSVMLMSSSGLAKVTPRAHARKTGGCHAPDYPNAHGPRRNPPTLRPIGTNPCDAATSSNCTDVTRNHKKMKQKRKRKFPTTTLCAFGGILPYPTWVPIARRCRSTPLADYQSQARSDCPGYTVPKTGAGLLLPQCSPKVSHLCAARKSPMRAGDAGFCCRGADTPESEGASQVWLTCRSWNDRPSRPKVQD